MKGGTGAGMGGERILTAGEYVIRSYGRVFTLTEFMEKGELPKATADRRLKELLQKGWITKDEDTSLYRISIPFRNMLVVAGRSLETVYLDQEVVSLVR